ncbi:hypothetical protein [Novacetimonas pomaceti]|uniref:hypothetical protein n=1 Tax=Novacetimonas pomaceti TaxID=2021998 RepID=UPI0010583994|nr:hypothetical protein [Novacetimonas pomaceti]
MTVIKPILPDRFENLERKARSDIGTIVVPITSALEIIDTVYARMYSTGRGAFLILKGASGAGKSTFLHTLHFFREDVETHSVEGSQDIKNYFRNAPVRRNGLIVHVLEEREALRSYSDRELEDWLHSINGYIRSANGENALVVWPCNTDELRERIVYLAERIGAESLLGDSSMIPEFTGPRKEQYLDIAERTLATLNQGSGLSDLGLTVDDVDQCAANSRTIGGFMTNLSSLITKRSKVVQKLIEREKCRLWVLVIAGNNPEGEVNGLTRGQYAAIDTERLLTSTGANIVANLRNYPDKIGLLGSVLDAKIFHLPVLAALEIARAFGSEDLKDRMTRNKLSISGNQDNAIERLNNTELGSIFRAGSQGTLARGAKLGSSSVEAFEKLVDIATTNDALLNKSLGEALVAARFIESYKVEQDFGAGLTRRTDLLAEISVGRIRIEVMWRKRVGRADIANYTLTKLFNYGKAIGYL